MRTLDQARPYAEVHGLPGAMYEQDGIMFKGNGMESLTVEPFIEDLPLQESNDPMPSVFCIEQSSEFPIHAHAEEPQGRDLANMHWRHLKALIEVYGESWENKEKAIAFLKGKA